MWPAFIFSVIAGGLFVVSLAYFFDTAKRLALNSIPTRYTPSENPKDDHIQIIVVGDIGRSPRMQYHAISVTNHGRYVDLVGYKGEGSKVAREIHRILGSNLNHYRDGKTPCSYWEGECFAISVGTISRMDHLGHPASALAGIQSDSPILHTLLHPHVCHTGCEMDDHTGEHDFFACGPLNQN